ncbi:MAG: hypothetical protein J5953_05780 [Prevotella sp.]|nr:hypothetical protein [Prevotella sp.]
MDYQSTGLSIRLCIPLWQYTAMNHFLVVLPWKGETTFLWCKPTAWKSEP